MKLKIFSKTGGGYQKTPNIKCSKSTISFNSAFCDENKIAPSMKVKFFKDEDATEPDNWVIEFFPETNKDNNAFSLHLAGPNSRSLSCSSTGLQKDGMTLGSYMPTLLKFQDQTLFTLKYLAEEKKGEGQE